jgi:hypothetical protein
VQEREGGRRSADALVRLAKTLKKSNVASGKGGCLANVMGLKT